MSVSDISNYTWLGRGTFSSISGTRFCVFLPIYKNAASIIIWVFICRKIRPRPRMTHGWCIGAKMGPFILSNINQNAETLEHLCSEFESRWEYELCKSWVDALVPEGNGLSSKYFQLFASNIFVFSWLQWSSSPQPACSCCYLVALIWFWGTHNWVCRILQGSPIWSKITKCFEIVCCGT